MHKWYKSLFFSVLLAIVAASVSGQVLAQASECGKERKVTGGALDEQLLERGLLKFSVERMEVSWNGVPVPLTVTEFWLIHSLMRVVFPKPAGAETKVSLPLNPAFSLSIKCRRETSSGRTGGMYSFVVSSAVVTKLPRIDTPNQSYCILLYFYQVR